jgi:hypothetical protein
MLYIKICLLLRSDGATGYAGYAPAYPAGLGSYHVCIRISRKKEEKTLMNT